MLEADQRPLRATFVFAILASAALTALIAALGPRLAGVPHLPDQGAAWYFWKLPAPTVWGRLTSWGFYALHQLSVWLLVFLAMRKRRNPHALSGITIGFLAVNLFFILLHILQTHLWYDGLAQDVPIWSSQYSVIVMLVIMLFMLNPRRGLLLGRKFPYSRAGLGFVNRWHGVYISWALVYTFWFHPTEGSIGLLVGFFYMFLLLTQLSMAGTRYHVSIAWITALEFTVGLHGPIIAIQNGYASWPMFAAGFLFMTAFTQQYGFKLPPWGRVAVFATYGAGVAVMYWFRGYARLYEVLFIPAALYGGAIALALLTRLVRGRGTEPALMEPVRP
ncbi:MAG TPA: hypothetical protein VFH83_04100 [Spirochaetia bacterium]|nr:hypothetical protein [Spirochaetia bacterium]